ncbi:hypothetical protein B4589_009535 [Halolamina sp. CBA1230]|uniref:hypothetical protein n=1 Tax=Halolamina sp. CBA1230 TaxID=1853690 RepID=UPI0009A13C3D|nr:hypothetical protein [Halolamina sp. CBA1230]QKY20607.1 hypothetical protein B4589_009535 [Halolamina sp. CBA1230]
MQKLRTDGSSGLVTIPRHYLSKDRVLDDGDVPDEQQVDVERLGERAYLVRIPDDGSLPDPQDCEVIERLVGQRILNEDAYGQPRSAD